MSVDSGRMGKAEGIALAFILFFPPLFLASPAELVNSAANLAWLCPALSAVGGGLMIYALTYVFERYPGDLIAVCRQLLGRFGTYVAGGYYFLVLFAIAALWLRQFADNTLLTALPSVSFDMIISWYTLSILFAVYAGLEAMCRSLCLIIPFSVMGMLLAFAGLIPQIQPAYLTPWLGHGAAALIQPTLMLTGLAAALIMLLIIAPDFQNMQTLRTALVIGVGGSALLRCASIAMLIMTFGVEVGAEKTLPFYELVRIIYISRYVQRVEALFLLIWVVIGVLAVAACLLGALYILAKLFRLPTVRPLLIPAVMLLLQTASLPKSMTEVLVINRLLAVYVFVPGSLLFSCLLIITAWIKGRKRHCEPV